MGTRRWLHFPQVGPSFLNVGITSGGTIEDAKVFGDFLYIVGSFDDVIDNAGTHPRGSGGCLDLTTGLWTSWDPGADGLIQGLDVTTSWVYLAGSFNSLNGGASVIDDIARVDPVTAAADMSWNPNPNASCRGVYADEANNRIFIGGTGFTTIGGGSRTRFASVDATTGALNTGFTCNVNTGGVDRIIPSLAGDLYVGGSGFTSIGGVTRRILAKVNPSTGVVDTTFDADITLLGGGTYAFPFLNADESKLIVCGNFDTVDGTNREGICMVDPATGALDLTFDPDLNDILERRMAEYNGQFYLAGRFTTVGGTSRNRAARVSATGAGGLDTTWNMALTATSCDVAVVFGNTVMFSGNISFATSQALGGGVNTPVSRLVFYNMDTGALL